MSLWYANVGGRDLLGTESLATQGREYLPGSRKGGYGPTLDSSDFTFLPLPLSCSSFLLLQPSHLPRTFMLSFGFWKLDMTKYIHVCNGLWWVTLARPHPPGLQSNTPLDVAVTHFVDITKAHNQLTLRDVIWNNPGGPDVDAERPQEQSWWRNSTFGQQLQPVHSFSLPFLTILWISDLPSQP